MKLELKHIVGYLANKVEVQYIDCQTKRKRHAYITNAGIEGIETTYKRKINNCSGDLISWEGHNNVHELKVKLLLRPLSDLTEEELNNLNNLHFYKSKFTNNLSDLTFWYGNSTNMEKIKEVFEYLYSKHFDIHGLIEKGLAIDINTL